MRLLSIFVFMLTVAYVGAASARDCKEPLTAVSEDATPVAILANELAREAAIGAWENRCERTHGDIYCAWPQARNRRLTCGRRNNGFGGYNFTCRARARPCSPY